MKNIKNIISLTVICAVVALALAFANKLTAPIIAKQESDAVNKALAEVLPGGSGFTEIDISKYTLPSTISEAYSAENGGYVFKMTTAGYDSGLILMCGIDADGKVTGATCISSKETLGYEATYGESLLGTDAEKIDSVDTVAGATKTTSAYRSAVKDALNAAIILGGGSVDIRDEAQILADSLSEALPAAEGKFTHVFITDELDGVSDVYKADNDAGYVFIIDDSFIATDINGVVTTQVSDDIKNKVTQSAKTVISSTMTEIDISGYENMPSHVQKAYKTTYGNYVFDLRAAGFGINGDEYYNPSGEYIYIRVSATADGKIISCETVSQKETDGVGSACEEPKFYKQFNGKTESNYKEIDAISGATITTNGYKTAVSKVFEAIKILKGENP